MIHLQNDSQLEELKVLWASEQSAPSDLSLDPAIRINHLSDINQIKLALEKEVYPIAFLDSQSSAEFFIEVLRFFKTRSHPVALNILVKNDAVGMISKAVNESVVFRVIPYDHLQKVIQQNLRESVEFYKKSLKQNELYKKAKQQNSELQSLTIGLEESVKERTRTASNSKKELEGRVSQLRDLVQFVRELSRVQSFEDLIQLIRQELRKIHGLGAPFLLTHLSVEHKKIYYLQSSEVLSKSVKGHWEASQRIRKNSKKDSQFLADVFGRPINRMISIPMNLNQELRDSGFKFPDALLFEHSLKDEEIDTFIDLISQWIQPIGITLDRIKVEESMNRISRMWERTFDGISDPICIIDDQYNVLRANKHFAHIIGKTKCYESFADQNQICEDCPIKKEANSIEPVEGEIRRMGKHFKVHSYPVEIDLSGKYTAIINHYVDVTRSKNLQSQMIQNEKISAIGHMAGNIAHELNNPLTGIRSLSQVLIRSTDDSPTLNSDLIEVEKAADRSQRIIKNLLEFSKDSDQQKSIQNLNEIIDKTLPLLKSVTGFYERDIELSESPLKVNVEPQLVQQVVFNLVKNACEAMPEHGKVTIRTSIDGTFAKLTVKDTGEGISTDQVSRIFDPFYTTKSEKEGTGLGLSMSKSVIESFGGKIWCESQIGQGTTFYILLPLVQEEI